MKITLVLGAGASHAMGYPVGSELRAQLLRLVDGDRQAFSITAGLFFDGDMLHQFVEAFRRSQMFSIDAFLARRPEFSEVGKRAIAALLLEVEDEAQLFGAETKDHWYRHFFNKFATEAWDRLDFSNISIVTFNYDRSLEKYLLGSIMNSYGKNEAQAAEKLKTLKIVHVYGSLGSPISGPNDYLAYGGNITAQKVQAAARSLRVIAEGRDDDNTLGLARDFLLNAERIAFLGFGFDETNVVRLNAKETCKSKMFFPGRGEVSRQIVATCKGMTDAEAISAAVRIGQERNGLLDYGSFPKGFYVGNCLDLLRESLILD